jgi:ABC-type uncharacterized transport system permease subunit
MRKSKTSSTMTMSNDDFSFAVHCTISTQVLNFVLKTFFLLQLDQVSNRIDHSLNKIQCFLHHVYQEDSSEEIAWIFSFASFCSHILCSFGVSLFASSLLTGRFFSEETFCSTSKSRSFFPKFCWILQSRRRMSVDLTNKFFSSVICLHLVLILVCKTNRI